MADREFTNINGIKVCDQTARNNIPTKTSQLTNDSGYITNIPDEYITETELNAKGYATTDQIPTVPTNVSAFTNDAGYTTETFVTNKIAEAQVGGGAVNVPENVALVVDITTDGTTEDYIPIMSSNATEYRLTINNAGIPVVKDVNGNIVFTCGTGGSSGGETGGGETPPSGGDAGGGETPPSGGDAGEHASGEPYVLEWTDNVYINNTNGKEESYVDWVATQYIPVHGFDCVKVAKSGNQGKYNAFYDINKNFIQAVAFDANEKRVLIPSNAAFLRISCPSADKNSYIVTPYAFPNATWTDGVAYDLGLMNDKYYEKGVLTDYAGWSATGVLNCVGASKLTITGNTETTPYYSFFDPVNVPFKVKDSDSISAGDSIEIVLPVGTCYFAMSNLTRIMNNVTITPHI